MPIASATTGMIGMANGFDPANLGQLEPELQHLVRRRRELLGPGYKLFYDEPLEIVRGLGTRLWDANGQEYIDAYNNVPAVGHCNPRVIDAVTQQLNTLNTHTRYASRQI